MGALYKETIDIIPRDTQDISININLGTGSVRFRCAHNVAGLICRDCSNRVGRYILRLIQGAYMENL